MDRRRRHLVRQHDDDVPDRIESGQRLDLREREHDDGTKTPLLLGLRDRALIGVMVFSFARISAVFGMKVEDYYPNGKRWWLRLHEKGGKFHELPAHHTAEAYLDAYIAANMTRK